MGFFSPAPPSRTSTSRATSCPWIWKVYLSKNRKKWMGHTQGYKDVPFSMSWKSTTLFLGIKCFGRYFFRHRHVFIIYILCLKGRLLWWSFVGENDSGRGYRWSFEWPDNFVWLYIIVVNDWLFSVRILTKTSCVLGMKFRQC